MKGVLSGLRVLDFTTLLPGPLATLMLARAGAEVIKVERPEGDPARADPAFFDIVNRGKRSIKIDLKRDAVRLEPLVAGCDILLEQFRPGVMDRLGFGFEAVRAINPQVIYVSINGYGDSGPDVMRPGHDLTWQAESGMLSLNADASGTPVLPSAMAADIAGGSLAAFSNIALALYQRERTGNGAHLQVAMFEGLLPLLIEPYAHALAGQTVATAYSPATGGSPRYNIYRAADGRYLALASPEEKFWTAFCERAGLPLDADKAMIAARLAERPAQEWLDRFEGADLCCSLVATVEEALASERVARLLSDGQLPVPLDRALRSTGSSAQAPELGEANGLLA